jgi:hypothetical protein
MDREMENCKANGIRNQAVTKEIKKSNEAVTKEIKKSNEAVTNHFFLHVGFLIVFFFFFVSVDMRQNSYKIL